MSDKETIAGLYRILGEKIGDKMVLGNILIYHRCILMNQE